MSLFSKRNSKLVFVLDISSDSIGGALVLKEDGRIPIILSSTREFLKLKNEIDISRIRKEMLVLLDRVCEKILRESGARPQKIHCIVGAPFAYGQLRFSVMNKSDGFIFTEKLAKKIINDEVLAFKKEMGKDQVILDKKITKVALNGYTVENPHNKKAKTSRIDIFLSVAGLDIVREIEDRIHKTFKAKIEFTSQMFSDFISVRNIFDIENDFIILNVGGEMTEVSVMKEDILVGTGYFPYGTNGIIRDLSKLLRKNLYETKSLISIFVEGHLGSELKKATEKNLAICLEKWRKELTKVLIEVLPTRNLPANIFLETSVEMEKILEKTFTKKNFREFTTLHEDFNVIIAGNKVLHPFCDFTESVNRDSSLTIKTIFINQI